MLISAENISKNYGMKQLLDSVSLYLSEGDRIGIIGINGTGKSTLLKILAGVTHPDSGNISSKPDLQISYLPQDPVMNEEYTVLEQVLSDMPSEYREVSEYEAKSMLGKLGINDYSAKVGTLSGGQRKRAALASALIHPADVLILDEPTNHLDSEMVTWLENRLNKTYEEHYQAGNKLRLEQPIGAVSAGRREVENPSALNVGVGDIENPTEKYDNERHAIFATHQHRKHKGALHIVNLKQHEEDERHGVESARRRPPQQRHHHHRGQLHKHPSQFVVDAYAPFLVVHHAIAGIYEVQRHKHYHGEHRHHYEEIIE